MKAVFGPVHSWRLGRTIGVDMVASDRNYCSFDCAYCPGGRRTRGVTRRRYYVELYALHCLLKSDVIISGHVPFTDYVAFTGRSEPTLAANLSQAIDLTRLALGLPVAVFTNSSLMPLDDVKHDLAKADMVVAKLDAPDEGLFRAINRPYAQYSLAEVVDAMREFRRNYEGEFVIQTTVVDANRASIDRIAAIAHDLSPDEFQLNSRLPGGDGRALATDVEKICSSFTDLNVTSPHAGGPSWERIVDAVELQRPRRPNAEVMLMAAAAG
jgi:wyosine [tRNA(Phe)-imidazoG37] synthetase (radical SAM superfamily)